MSLIICPECKNEVSNQADACPSCGFPFAESETIVVKPTPIVAVPPPVERRNVVVAPVRRENKFPNWIFVPIVLALAFVVFGFIWMMSNNRETANENINVRIRETASANSRTTRSAADAPTTVNPPSTADSTVVLPPTTTAPPVSTFAAFVHDSSADDFAAPATSDSTTLPAPAPDKGNLAVTAAIVSRNGSKNPVRREKFYLLKEDLNTIFSKAKIVAVEGDYESTLGAAIADPARKASLDQMLAAIKPYIVASITTDANGKATFKGVKPDGYYLFGVTRVGNSASVWNQSININAGENTISLDGNAPIGDTSGRIENNSYQNDSSVEGRKVEDSYQNLRQK